MHRFAFALLAALTALLPTPAAAQHFDLLIRGGQVLDGSGSPAYTADVGITDDEIVSIGRLPGATATRIIDATGKYVVPGFIDMHSHADRSFASPNIEGRRAHNLVMQGITTSVFGPDGRNPAWPIAAEMDAYRTPGVATNVVPMVGHGTVPLPLWQIPSIVDGQPLTGTDGMRETIEIGRAGRTPFEQLVHFALDATELQPAGVRFRPVAGHRFDVENYMRREYTATSTDGSVSLRTRPGQHPRSYGAFARKIAHYAKERGVITLPFAIRSSTGLPAQIIGLRDRGYLRQGYKADLVVFDYETISSPATIMEPDRYPTGIEYVLVNGRFTVDDGKPTGALPGAVLDRREKDKTASNGVSE